MNELLDAVATTTTTTEAGIRNGLLHHDRAGFERVGEADHRRRIEGVAVAGFPVEDRSAGDLHRFGEVTCPADLDTVIGERRMPDSH